MSFELMASQEDEISRISFIKGRNSIHNEIASFLFVVLSSFVNFEYFGVKQEFIVNRISKKFPSLIKSLCQIHGLYGYPASTKFGYSPEDEVPEVKPDAVKEIFDSLKKNDRTLGCYYKFPKEDELRQFESLTDMVRQPAYILLEMMKDLFDDPKDACKTTLEILGNLRDGNCLKPVYWAENRKDPEKFGISLDVRCFVQPLYLHAKLCEIREHGDNGVKLEDVDVYKCVDKACWKRKPVLVEHMSKYKIRKNGEPRRTRRPCTSCRILFDKLHKHERVLSTFGTCAEYDVIKTHKLEDLLRSSTSEMTSWGEFELACKIHLDAFKKLTAKIGKGHADKYSLLKEYFESTHKPITVNVLKFEWSSESYDYKLKAIILETKYPDNRHLTAAIQFERKSSTGCSTHRKRKRAEDAENNNRPDKQMLIEPVVIKGAGLSESESESEDNSEDGYDDGGYDYSRKELKKELDDKFKSPEYQEKMNSLFQSLELKK